MRGVEVDPPSPKFSVHKLSFARVSLSNGIFNKLISQSEPSSYFDS